VLPRSAGGTYQLAVAAEQVDVHLFHELTARARGLAGSDDLLAAASLDQALQLHRGEPLAGLGGAWIDGYRHTLTEERRAAELRFHEVSLRLGRHLDQIAELSRLFTERPGDEWVAWLCMLALYRAGRQGDALEVYGKLRVHLDQTIAAESLEALAELHQRILRGDASLLRPEAVAFWPEKLAPAQPHEQREEKQEEGDQRMAEKRYINIAKDHARVGIQAAQINGTIRYSGRVTAADLSDELVVLREMLSASLRDNELDEPAYALAERYLSAAAAQLALPGEAARQAFIQNLSRLGELVAADTDLAVRVRLAIDLAEEVQ
jgi:DNA-binding SARP family transcriptional activator